MRGAGGVTEAAAPGSPKTFTVRVPSPFRVVSAPETASDVLYQNPVPPFPLLIGGTGVALAGNIPGQLPVGTAGQRRPTARARPGRAARGHGPDRPALRDRARTDRRRAKASVVIGLTHLDQVNALQLQFPTSMRVVQVTGPEGTSTSIVSGSTIQLVASTAFFQEGVPYTFDVSCSRRAETWRADHPAREHALLRERASLYRAVLPRLTATLRRGALGARGGGESGMDRLASAAMRRVLLAFEPPDGGVAENVAQLALGLGDHGWQVELAAPRRVDRRRPSRDRPEFRFTGWTGRAGTAIRATTIAPHASLRATSAEGPSTCSTATRRRPA